MTLRDVADKSFIVSLWRYFYSWYDFFGQRLIYIYQQSQIHRLIGEFGEKIKVCFRYSCLGGIAETKVIAAALDNSLITQYLIGFYKSWKDRIISYLKISLAIKLAEDTKKGQVLSPVRIVSVVVITAVVANALLSFVLHQQISQWGWLIRGLFLFVAIFGIFCQADWSTVQESSIFLRKLSRN